MLSCLRGYFVGPKIFLVGISRVQNFSRGHFMGSKYLWRVFVGAAFLLLSISWVQFFFLVVDFVIQRFSVAVTKTVIQRYISNHVFFSKSIPAYCMTLRFRRSFVADKKDRRANFSLIRSLQTNKQQNQIDFINQLTKSFYKKSGNSVSVNQSNHIFLLWNYLNF